MRLCWRSVDGKPWKKMGITRDGDCVSLWVKETSQLVSGHRVRYTRVLARIVALVRLANDISLS